MRAHLLRAIRRFVRRDDGVALVEFALLFPMMLLIFAVIIESSRTFWAYQSVISAVRDATRYAARAADTGMCPGGGTLTALQPRVAELVNASIMPGAVTITNITTSADCTGNIGLRTSDMPVATVTAELRIDMPFAGIFRLAGSNLGAITTSVSNSTRIYSQ